MEKTKPTYDEAIQLRDLKNAIKQMHKTLNKVEKALFDKHGEGRFDYQLDQVDEEGHGWMKVVIVDNIKKMQEGQEVWKSVSAAPLDLSIGLLKRKPKTLA